jgi:hypothetical protein
MIHDSTGTETRQVRSTAANPNALSVEVVANTSEVSTTLGDGSKNVTTAGSAVALASSTACDWVTITAKLANTGVIYVGGASISATTGTPLYSLDTVKIPVSNLSAVYINSSVNGEGVTYTYGV